MPITSSAKKAMRQTKDKQATNYRVRLKLKKAVDKVRKGSDEPVDLSQAYTALDRAAKSGVIHKNKSSRLKSRLNKLVKSRSIEKKVKKETPKAKKPSKK